MKKTIFLLLFSSVVFSQTAFQNFGNLQVHTNGQIGFHTDFVNDGISDQNSGFTGFYSFNGIRTVSGNNRAIFHNVDIDALNNLELYTSLGVSNQFTFVTGKIITPRNNTGVSLDFINYDFHVGEDDQHHTDGYTSVLSNQEFTFPIGDDDRFRPMITPSQNKITSFKGAYFFEDPNAPSTFTVDFLTSNKQVFLENISNYEFWDLDGDEETKVTLTWDDQSDITSISTDIKLLRVVGWSESENKWIDLGQTAIDGDTSSGKITSIPFVPNNYKVITIGSEYGAGEFSNDNYIISPNGDNVNDALVFEGLEKYSSNKLSIFNRWGNLVYKVENYKNDWEGISNGRLTITAKKGLPVGTYFYILKIEDEKLNTKKNGWVYIHR
ncbi:gliding motility-associated C-terminal domain-containing protein [Tenacibaculum sp.]|nr:gliding motility-associated C-terminal domain-containing protein [Tenacibaculum sp.]